MVIVRFFANFAPALGRNRKIGTLYHTAMRMWYNSRKGFIVQDHAVCTTTALRGCGTMSAERTLFFYARGRMSKLTVRGGEGMIAIAAVERSWGIGLRGELLLRNKADMKRFRERTMGHPVILGRKTLESFPGGRPLPGRENLILSTTMEAAPEGAKLFRDLDSLLDYAPADSFVIGGGEVYRQLLPYCHEAQITYVDAHLAADAFFPDLDAHPQWELAEEEGPFETEEGVPFTFRTYRRVEL